MRTLTFPKRLSGMALAAALALPGLAAATPIDPGFDLFQTEPGTFVDLSGFGGPAVVALEGVPLAGLGGDFTGLGTTDTIVERLQGIDPFDPPGGVDTIPIELVALHLRSVAPVDLGGTLFDLDILGGRLLLPNNPSPLGEMTIRHTHAGGGDFDSTLPVLAQITATAVGNPANQQVVQFQDTFSATGADWCHQPAPGKDPHTKAHTADFPAGGFYAGVFCDSTAPMPAPFDEAAALANHRVGPAQVPEPASAALLGLGITLVAFGRRRRAAA